MSKLDEEIARYLRDECSADDEPTISEIAKHFAEWQREQVKDALKKQDQCSGCTNVKGCVTCVDGNMKELTVEDVLEQGKRFGRTNMKVIEYDEDKDLEEAAEDYAYTNWESDDYHEGASEGLPFDAIGHTEKCFIAGAKWQKEQDDYDTIFWKGGKHAIEQMMKEAVEGEVADFSSNSAHPMCYVTVEAKGYKHGDKVKLVIIKEDGKE